MKASQNNNLLQKYGVRNHRNASSRYHIPLPNFIAKKEIGLGDIIQRATAIIGIKPCEACRKRAATLNKKIVFGRLRKK
jgi:hypothetical protein